MRKSLIIYDIRYDVSPHDVALVLPLTCDWFLSVNSFYINVFLWRNGKTRLENKIMFRRWSPGLRIETTTILDISWVLFIWFLLIVQEDIGTTDLSILISQNGKGFGCSFLSRFSPVLVMQKSLIVDDAVTTKLYNFFIIFLIFLILHDQFLFLYVYKCHPSFRQIVTLRDDENHLCLVPL